jgi:uncharacterized membrane-anchored protein YhcB (DUF1043 family)
MGIAEWTGVAGLICMVVGGAVGWFTARVDKQLSDTEQRLQNQVDALKSSLDQLEATWTAIWVAKG